MIVWLLWACSGRTAGVASPGRVEVKADAAVEVVRVDAEGGSLVRATFPRGGDHVVVAIWGASGLEAVGLEQEVGQVEAGQAVSFGVRHVGAGDLAVRVSGVWSGEAGESVVALPVGRAPEEPVPRTTPASKGWESTRR